MQSLYVIDASGYLYRSYFAIKGMSNKAGLSTNALFGFIRSVQKLIKDFAVTNMVAVFDGPNSISQRVAIYPEYKAHRTKMPQDLFEQIALAKNFCRAHGIPLLDIAGVEADDTMATVAIWAQKNNFKTYLCTSDKDMCQLVNQNVFILNTFKNNLILDANGVNQQFGVMPEQIVDYLSIIGDASDNIPGVAGCGPKTATELLDKFGTLEKIFANLDELPPKKAALFEKSREAAFLSQKLIYVATDVEIPQTINFYQLQTPDFVELSKIYREMEFKTLLSDILDKLPERAETQKTEFEAKIEHINHISEIKTGSEMLLKFVSDDCLAIASSAEKIYLLKFSPEQSQNILTELVDLIASQQISLVGHGLKNDLKKLHQITGSWPKVAFDSKIASYLLNATQKDHNLSSLIETFLTVKIKDDQNRDLHILSAIFLLQPILSQQLQKRALYSLFENIELPLVTILAKMESNGIFIDVPEMELFLESLKAKISTLAAEIYDLAGEEFNLNSPKQVGAILFEKLAISPPKKTANGYSTSAEVLETLKEKHLIAAKLLDYRSIEKLRSTYLSPLPSFVDRLSRRIHASFKQTATATGRLACHEPNLQNIPVRTEIGRQVRAAFKPQKIGYKYLAADYSQIELRLLAHLSEDSELITAFNQNIDIHAYTASLVFNCPLAEVKKEQRYQAKTVNFGILYGQQAFSLAKELKIDLSSAKDFIKNYFERYSGVKKYIAESIAFSREQQKAVTILGRERSIP